MIPPGGEGQIKVTLRPKGSHREISKNIVVFSNDPAQPQMTLTMKGKLLVDVVALPPAISLLNLGRGEAGTQTFSVQRGEDSDASVKSVRLEDTDQFSIREVDPAPDSLATYEVRFEGRDDIGTSHTNVVVETTGEHTPQLKIAVRANVAANLIYPKRVAIMRREGQPLERTIRISSRRGDPPKIGKIEDPDGLLDIDVLEPEPTSVSLRLRVRDGETVDDAGVHPLRLHTNDPEQPKLELTYEVRTSADRRRSRARGAK